MIGFHRIETEGLFASGADTRLAFVGPALHRLAKRTNVQVAFITCQDVRVDALLPLNVVIVDHPQRFSLGGIEIHRLAVVVVVQRAPTTPRIKFGRVLKHDSTQSITRRKCSHSGFALAWCW